MKLLRCAAYLVVQLWPWRSERSPVDPALIPTACRLFRRRQRRRYQLVVVWLGPTSLACPAHNKRTVVDSTPPPPTLHAFHGLRWLRVRVTTTAAVKEGSKETTTPETLGLICNVAIVQHEGVLQTRWDRATAPPWIFFCVVRSLFVLCSGRYAGGLFCPTGLCGVLRNVVGCVCSGG